MFQNSSFLVWYLRAWIDPWPGSLPAWYPGVFVQEKGTWGCHSCWTDAQKVRLGLLAINSKSPLELNSTLCERGRAFIKEVRCALKLKHNGFAYSLLKLGFKNLLLKIKGEKQITAVMFCFHSWQSAFLETFILGRNPLPSECMCLFLLSEVFLDVWEYHTITL